jgi:isopenicillin N synthase-like dioxygenase
VWLPETVLPGFREFMLRFYWQCFETAKELLRAVTMGLGLSREETESLVLRHHTGLNNQLRLLHYPPIPREKLLSIEVARMPAHSDWGSITMLFQDECGGLQVEDPNKPGIFLDAEPIEGALVLNVGDLLMRWSNDTLRSTLHRVTLPPAQGAKGGAITPARYSIPYFVSPDPEVVVECLIPDEPAKYPPVVWEDYRRLRAKLMYPEGETAGTSG